MKVSDIDSKLIQASPFIAALAESHGEIQELTKEVYQLLLIYINYKLTSTVNECPKLWTVASARIVDFWLAGDTSFYLDYYIVHGIGKNILDEFGIVPEFTLYDNPSYYWKPIANRYTYRSKRIDEYIAYIDNHRAWVTELGYYMLDNTIDYSRSDQWIELWTELDRLRKPIRRPRRSHKHNKWPRYPAALSHNVKVPRLHKNKNIR